MKLKGIFTALVLSVTFAALLAGFGSRDADAAEPVTISGTFYQTHGDPPDGPPKTHYTLIDSAGKEWSLNIPPSVAESVNRSAATRGVSAQVTGTQTGESSLDVQSLSFDSASGAFAAPLAAPISGSKAFKTLLCKFSDVAAEPQNLAFFDGMMGSTKPGADDYWQELSYGAIDLVGSAQHDWLVLPGPRSDYVDDTHADNQGSDRTKLFNDCKQVHEDNGVSFAGVFGINLIFNDVLDCCAWGGGRDGFAVTWMPPWSWGRRATVCWRRKWDTLLAYLMKDARVQRAPTIPTGIP